MKIEHIIKRDNGDKIVIIIETTNSLSTSIPLFDVSITITPTGKRKPTVYTSSCSFGENVFGWEWRKWDLDERREKEKDYIRNMDQEVEIRTYRAINKCKEFYGLLRAYDDSSVTIETEDEDTLVFQKSDIALIRQAVRF